MTKYWDECTKREHKEIKNWNKKREYNLKCFEQGKFDDETFMKNIASLSLELKEIEERYGQD